MIKISMEYWVIFQISVDLILVILILYLLRNMKAGLQKEISSEAAEKVINIIEPFLADAESAADAFGKQLHEKNRLIHDLNKKLDNRIISLNLLLNRANDSMHNVSEELSPGNTHVYDQLKGITQLYEKGNDAGAIAGKLSMPKGEVDLVLDLKRKLLAME